jgi:hypothetical protein
LWYGRWTSFRRWRHCDHERKLLVILLTQCACPTKLAKSQSAHSDLLQEYRVLTDIIHYRKWFDASWVVWPTSTFSPAGRIRRTKTMKNGIVCTSRFVGWRVANASRPVTESRDK